MPKGLDPNASFRRPVNATKEFPKVLVDCDLLERLIRSVNYMNFEYEIDELNNHIAAARKAQESHRG